MGIYIDKTMSAKNNHYSLSPNDKEYMHKIWDDFINNVYTAPVYNPIAYSPENAHQAKFQVKTMTNTNAKTKKE